MRSTFVFFLVAGVSTIVSLVVLTFIFMRYWGLTAVEGPPPETFPVLVSQPGPTCAVVLWRELASAKNRATAWSYMAPTSELAECQLQLRPDATLRVQVGEDGQQRITLTSSPGGDEVNVSRYLTTSGGIEPISHQRYFGPAIAIIAAAASGLLGAITGVIGVWFFRRRRATAL